MKRAQRLLCICLLLVLASCNQTLPLPEDLTGEQAATGDPSNPNSYENPIKNTQFEPAALYQYFLLNGVLARFNVTTGEVTYLCDDPLCSHDEKSDCLFADVGFQFLVDDAKHVIWYVTDRDLVKYDFAKKKAQVLYTVSSGTDTESNGGASTSLSLGYYWYRDAYAKVFFRVDLETGAYEQLDPAYDIPAAYVDGRYYCTASGSPATEVYSLDASMQDKQSILADCILYYVRFDHVTSQDSGYLTFSEWREGELVPCTYDLATHRKDTYKTAPKSGLTWGDYICYTQPAKEPRLMGECGLNGKIYNRTGGVVYRYNTATDQEEILFSNDDLVIGNPEIIGGYLVYDFGAFVNHELFHCPFWQTDAGGKLVIDIETGNYCVYFNTWDKTLSQY